MHPRLVAAITSLALLWGIAFVAIKELLSEISPVTLTVLRFAIADACVVAVMIVWRRARPRFARADVWRLVVLGITGVPSYHLALNWGEHRTSASVGALIVATAPVMVAIGSVLVLRDRITVRKVSGIALAFGGVVLLTFGRPEAGGGERTQLAGFLVALLAPLSWAVYTIVAKPLTARVEAVRVTAITILIGSLMLAPLMRASTIREITTLSGAGWAWVGLLGAGSSVAGYILFVWALGRMDVTKVSVALYLVPIVGVSSAALIRDEPLGVVVAVAAALVVGGVAVVQRDERAPSPPAEAPAPVPIRR